MRGFRSDSYGDAFADVYDEWYADVSDLPATVSFVADLCGPTGSVLELGVGTGRLAVPLAGLVGTVTGIDTSARMLEELAKADATRTIRVVQGDMVDDLPDGPYDVVLAAYNTVFNLTSAERQQACFDHVARRLAPGGAFVVEAFVPAAGPDAAHGSDSSDATDATDAADRAPTRGSQVSVRSMTVDAVVLSASVHDSAAQTAEGHFIEITETGGVRLRPWAIRWSTPTELDAMATNSGLVRAQRWGDFDRSAFGPGSSRHVTVYTPATPGNHGVVRTSLGQSL